MYLQNLPSLAVLLGFFMNLSNIQAMPLDSRGCNAECEYNRHHPPKKYGPGKIIFGDWAPSSESCPDDQTCSSNADAVPLIALDGAGFGPNTYALFAVYWHENNQEVWSAYAPVDDLGYTGIGTPLRDCSSYSDAPKNNAYARAYDARASEWGVAIDLSTGCNDTIL